MLEAGLIIRHVLEIFQVSVFRFQCSGFSVQVSAPEFLLKPETSATVGDATDT
jgi:hypothetical protein